jgi:hypothetical protein
MSNLNLAYDNATDYTYDSNKIEVANGIAHLISASATNHFGFEGTNWLDNDDSSETLFTTGDFVQDTVDYYSGSASAKYSTGGSTGAKGHIATNITGYSLPMTIEFWHNFVDGAASGTQSILSINNTTDSTNDLSNCVWLVMYNSNGTTYLYNDDSHYTSGSGVISGSAGWHKITLKWYTDKAELYIDDTLKLTQTANTTVPSPAYVWLGSDVRGYGCPGSYDDFSITTSGYQTSDIVNNNALVPNTNSRYTGFIETLGTNNQGVVKYQLSQNGTDFYYWTGTAWSLASSGQYNEASVINDNIGSFDASTGQLFVKAFLITDGTQQVELDNVEVDFVNEGSNGVGNTGTIIIVGTNKVGGTGLVATSQINQVGATGYVGKSTNNKVGNTSEVVSEATNKAGATGAVVFNDTNKVGATGGVSLGTANKVGATGAVKLNGANEVGNAGYVGTSVSNEVGNAGNVYTTANNKAGATGNVNVNSDRRIGNSGAVRLIGNNEVGNTGVVNNISTSKAGATAIVQAGGANKVGNTGAVQSSSNTTVGATSKVVIQHNVGNTASSVVWPEYQELRKFEIYREYEISIHDRE